MEAIGIILSLSLIFLSATAFNIGVSFYKKEKEAGEYRKFMLFIGIFCGLWCLGYGAIGLIPYFIVAKIARIISLFGIIGFLVAECYIIIDMGYKDPVSALFYKVFIFFYALSDWIIFSNSKVDSFVRIGSWTTWYGNMNFERYYHFFFLASMIVLMTLFAIVWFINSKYRRTKKFIICLFFSNVFIILGALPDTILNVYKLPAFPTSGIGGFLTTYLLWYFSTRYNSFNITLTNLSSYVYDSLNVAILALNDDDRIQLANNYAKAEFPNIKRGISGIGDVFTLTDITVNELYRKVIKLGEIECRGISMQTGKKYALSITAIYDEVHDPYCILCAAYDISKEEELIKQVTEANNAKSDFLANMSHEIRTPINAVLGMDEMILRESEDKKILEYAENIQTAGRALLALINDILDFSKIESGCFEIMETDYSLASLLNDSMSMLVMRATEKNLKMSLDCDSKIPSKLTGDEVRIRQILINLLSNAVKYTKEGKITLRARYNAIDNDNINLILEVQDTGIGIKDDNISDIFSNFVRIEEKRNRNIEGTGLGLAITKLITDLMDGDIEVSSVYGEGSTFRVTIPQKVADSTPVGDVNERYIDNSKTITHKDDALFTAPDAKILVVDDVKMNITVIRGLLKRTQIQVDTAISGKSALELIEKNKYDLIFMDHMMPDMDGVETYNKMKEEGTPNDDTPVIMLTANAINGVKEQYIEEGFADYLPKPVRGKELEEMLKKYLPKDKILTSVQNMQ